MKSIKKNYIFPILLKAWQNATNLVFTSIFLFCSIYLNFFFLLYLILNRQNCFQISYSIKLQIFSTTNSFFLLFIFTIFVFHCCLLECWCHHLIKISLKLDLIPFFISIVVYVCIFVNIFECEWLFLCIFSIVFSWFSVISTVGSIWQTNSMNKITSYFFSIFFFEFFLLVLVSNFSLSKRYRGNSLRRFKNGSKWRTKEISIDGKPPTFSSAAAAAANRNASNLTTNELSPALLAQANWTFVEKLLKVSVAFRNFDWKKKSGEFTTNLKQ